MGSQSTAKTFFLLGSMVGWLLVGAALMYLFPVVADWLIASEQTHQWMATLSRGSYDPRLGWMGGGIILVITVAGNILWYQRFDGKV
ncbi:hypothetical protein C7271_08050 [filamentous cyanobacterium CCP5]|nr:hypothetical protein C7271_08050 [filamentous cyanobacterium CCP5]